MKKYLARATPLMVGATMIWPLFPSLIGCSSPEPVESESVRSLSQALVVSRMHHEEIDPESGDGLMYTYWERDLDSNSDDDTYSVGAVVMDLQPNGYSAFIDNTSYESDPDYVPLLKRDGVNWENPNFVGGKGRRTCYGETMHWDVLHMEGEEQDGDPKPPSLHAYGWMEDPLVEWYIGRAGGTPVEVTLPDGTFQDGTYETPQGTYKLFVQHLDQENVLDPHDYSPFLQFNAQSLEGVPPEQGPVNLHAHFEAWERLMSNWWPAQTALRLDHTVEGLPHGAHTWHQLVKSHYCVVATELWGPNFGYTRIDNISFEEHLSLLPVARAVDPSGTTDPLVYRVTSSEPWTLETDSIPTWVNGVSPVTGPAGVTFITLNVDPYADTVSERRANIFINTASGNIAGLQAIQFYVGEGRVARPAGEGLDYFMIRDGGWSAESTADWLDVTPSSGTNGTYNLYLPVQPNATGADRTATVTITGGGQALSFVVTQASLAQQTSPTFFELDGDAASNSFEVYSDAAWWSAYTTAGGGWLTINSSSGSGHGTVSFSVTANTTGQTRTADITLIGGNVPPRVIPVTQEPQESPPCDPSNRLVNPGFEFGTTGWTTWGASLATSTSPVHGGAKSGKVTNRSASWHGPVQDLMGKVEASHTYDLAGWAKVSGSQPQPLKLTVYSQCTGGSPQYTQVDTATGSPSQWTWLSGEFTVPSCALSALALYIEGPSPGITLYADDMSVAEACQ